MKELVILSAILLTVVGGVIVTYWTRTKEMTASADAGAVRVTTSDEARPRMRAVAPAPAPGEAEVSHADVYFDFKSIRLRADAVRVLQEKAALMDKGSAWVVVVQGYADNRGPGEFNRALAQRRAEAVKAFLVDLGVPETSIKVVTIGQEGAVCDDPSKECQQLNRRVHLEIRKLAHESVAPLRPALAEGAEIDMEAPGAASPGTGR